MENIYKQTLSKTNSGVEKYNEFQIYWQGSRDLNWQKKDLMSLIISKDKANQRIQRKKEKNRALEKCGTQFSPPLLRHNRSTRGREK